MFPQILSNFWFLPHSIPLEMHLSSFRKRSTACKALITLNPQSILTVVLPNSHSLKEASYYNYSGIRIDHCMQCAHNMRLQVYCYIALLTSFLALPYRFHTTWTRDILHRIPNKPSNFLVRFPIVFNLQLAGMWVSKKRPSMETMPSHIVHVNLSSLYAENNSWQSGR